MSLRDYVLKHVDGHANALGLNVLHDWRTEAPYSADQPLFAQRKYVQLSREYSKPAVHTSGVLWGQGFHETDHPFSLAAGLYMFHTRAFDRDISVTRINNRNRLAWTADALEHNHGWQNRLSAEQYLAEFYGHSEADFHTATPPDRFNSAVLQFAGFISEHPRMYEGPVKQFERPILTLPGRFGAAIGSTSDLNLSELSLLSRRPDLPDGNEVYARSQVYAKELLKQFGR